MIWGQRARKPAGDEAVVGLDINATRCRAAVGPAGLPPRAALLDESSEELPLALALDRRPAGVGHVALGHRRRSPHLLCSGFLPLLGEPRTWTAGRQKFDAAAALTAVASAASDRVGPAKTVYAALPAYLTLPQVQFARAALESARLPLAGSCSAPLAAAVATGLRRAVAVFLDADDHASVWSLLLVDARAATVAHSVSLPHFGVRAWVERLMDSAADQCIRLCRRDPRDSAGAEQALEDQIAEYLRPDRADGPLGLSVRTEHWFQNFVFAPDEIARACGGPARVVADGLRQLLDERPGVTPDAIYLSAAAARLPGLATLIDVRRPDRAAVERLAINAIEVAAHALAVRRSRADLPALHLDTTLPLVAAADRSGVSS